MNSVSKPFSSGPLRLSVHTRSEQLLTTLPPISDSITIE
jgi:hypothetical protein